MSVLKASAIADVGEHERYVVAPVAEFAALSVDSFAPVLARTDELDFVVVGTGARLELIGREIRDAFKERGVGLEAMDTGAACRTFNVLLLEERRLAAALIAVD